MLKIQLDIEQGYCVLDIHICRHMEYISLCLLQLYDLLDMGLGRFQKDNRNYMDSLCRLQVLLVNVFLLSIVSLLMQF
jgi:hypothetical protein